jgi:proteasome lid subunit RPN8/RPN11
VLLRAYRRAENEGLEVLGVFHSHTHSEAYPSPTDVAQAPDPTWHYVIVSFARRPSVVRSYRIENDLVTEEPVLIVE